MSEKEEGADVPAEQKAGWGAFIKSLAHMTGDLSSMTAPPFILSPVSLTEFPAYWCEHPDLFAAISQGKNEQDRMERVLKWFIATLKGQYTTRNEKMGSEKKPLNPVLGELFYGVWPDKNGRGETQLVVEQVSHHPPITAYFIENKKAGVALQGHSGQKTAFTGTAINVKQSGHAVLYVTVPGGAKESYLITLPKLRIEGIIWGSPYIELVETSAIQSSTGYTAQIDYKGKGYFSGKAHSYKAVVTAGSKTVQTYEGQWDGVSTVHKGPVFLDMSSTANPKEEVTVKPISEQGEWESRRLWEKVAKGIRTGNYDEAGKEKSRIENEQRQRRKDEAGASSTWKLTRFEHVDSDPDYQRLAGMLHDKLTPAHEDSYIFQG